jgi:hypothetical protein
MAMEEDVERGGIAAGNRAHQVVVASFRHVSLVPQPS